jgi:UDP-sugar transporter A1/2/3
MVEEIFKMGFSAFFFLSCGKEVVSSELHGWTLSSSLLLAGLPALLYATQGVLTYLGYQNTDSVTFNGLNQTKTLSAALWCFLLMGKRQSAVQMVALTILLLSALLFQGSISISGLFQKKAVEENANADSNSVNGGATSIEKTRAHTSISKGIIPCLGAAFISGLAGALSQKGVQFAGGKGRNPYLYTMELGLYSSISLLFSLFATKNGRKALKEEGGIFKHWTPLSIIPIAVRALGGILTALVHKHAGATRKGFALILGLIMTGVTQSWIEGERLSGDELMAMVLVILSSYLHLTYPPMAKVL